VIWHFLNNNSKGFVFFYALFQNLLKPGLEKNFICNKDNVLYNNFMWIMHDWLKEHKTFAVVV